MTRTEKMLVALLCLAVFVGITVSIMGVRKLAEPPCSRPGKGGSLALADWRIATNFAKACPTNAEGDGWGSEENDGWLDVSNADEECDDKDLMDGEGNPTRIWRSLEGVDVLRPSNSREAYEGCFLGQTSGWVAIGVEGVSNWSKAAFCVTNAPVPRFDGTYMLVIGPVRVCTTNGDVFLAEGMTADEAAMEFWRAVANAYPQMFPEGGR